MLQIRQCISYLSQSKLQLVTYPWTFLVLVHKRPRDSWSLLRDEQFGFDYWKEQEVDQRRLHIKPLRCIKECLNISLESAHTHDDRLISINLTLYLLVISLMVLSAFLRDASLLVRLYQRPTPLTSNRSCEMHISALILESRSWFMQT